ncbi:MAG: iron ABC transporter permease [Thermodesulfobacteriota bacterium]
MSAGPGPLLRRWLLIWTGLLALLALAALTALVIGPAGKAGPTLAALLGSTPLDPTMATILWQIRLPRLAVAALVGGSLAASGLVFQALLRNPLAEPYVLGVSGGAAIGAIAGFLFGLPAAGTDTLALAGGLASLAIVLLIGRRTGLAAEGLLLAGVMVNAFASAVILFLLAMSREQSLSSILFWLMGDLGRAEPARLFALAAVVLPGLVLVAGLGQAMNLLVLGGELAASMGLAVGRVTVLLLVAASTLIGTTVAQVGPVGFVGLVVPHILRRIWGADHRLLVPASFLAGAAYLVLCDLAARTLPREGELPVGVVTALFGAPLFIVLLGRRRP